MTAETSAAWIARTMGHNPRDPALFARALTHASRGEAHYERLEFLGDRVLGVVIASWLYALFPDEAEGKLSRRYNALVSRETCAAIARDLGLSDHMVLGKQARDDGASDSDNVLGDVIEALIGALFLEAGLDAVSHFVRRAWGALVEGQEKAPRHPKSELQEWAAANKRKPPAYRLTSRTGPHHAPRFVVEVAIANVGTAKAEGLSKQEAEKAAAAALLERISH